MEHKTEKASAYLGELSSHRIPEALRGLIRVADAISGMEYCGDLVTDLSTALGVVKQSITELGRTKTAIQETLLATLQGQVGTGTTEEI